MEKLTICKNKGELFKCHFDVDGADAEQVNVRLCLEFGDNKNMFFHGKLSENGECTIQIPRLTEVDAKTGKLSVEAIADSTYFKLYECDVILKNSVDIKINKKGFFEEPDASMKETKIQLANIQKARIEEDPVEEVPEEPVIESENPYRPNLNKIKEIDETEKETPANKTRKNFQDYLKRNKKS